MFTRMFFGCMAFGLGLSILTATAHADVPGVSDDNGGAGFLIPDNGSVESLIRINRNERIVSASFSVEGLQHSWIGDLIINVAHSTSGRTATLMHRVGTTASPGSTGDSSDVNGTYTFSDGNPSIWSAAANGDTTFIVPAGTYDASGENEAAVNLDAVFGGVTTAGDWTVTIADANETQSGQFLRTSLFFVSVPEPNSLIVVVGLALFLPARRRQ